MHISLLLSLFFIISISISVEAEYCSNEMGSEVRCRNAGFCNSSLICECLPMFKGDFCELPRRSQFVAFMLSFMFTNFGAMNWYLGLFSIAIAQTVLGVITCGCCIPLSFARKGLSDEENKAEGMKKAIYVIIIAVNTILNLMMVIWWLCDWPRVLNHNIVDGLGDELYWDIHPFPTGN